MYSSKIDVRSAGTTTMFPENVSRVGANSMREQAMREQGNNSIREGEMRYQKYQNQTIFDDDVNPLPVHPRVSEQNGYTSQINENIGLVTAGDLKYIARSQLAEKSFAIQMSAQNELMRGNYEGAEYILGRLLTPGELMKREVSMNPEYTHVGRPARQYEVNESLKETTAKGPEGLLNDFQITPLNYYSKINTMNKRDVAMFYDAFGVSAPMARTNDVMRRKLIEWMRDNVFNDDDSSSTGTATPLKSPPSPISFSSSSSSAAPSSLSSSSSSSSSSSLSYPAAKLDPKDLLLAQIMTTDYNTSVLQNELKQSITTARRKAIIAELKSIALVRFNLKEQMKKLLPNTTKKGNGLKNALRLLSHSSDKRLDKIGFGLNMMEGDRLKERLSILTGEIEAGNDSKQIKNELSDLMKVMGQQGLMTKHKASRITRVYIRNV